MHLELLVSIKQAFFWEDGNLIGNLACKYVKKKKENMVGETVQENTELN